MKNKMQEILLKLGRVGVFIYFGLFFLTLFGFWCALSFGMDLKSWSFFSKLGVIEDIGIWGLAYAATKITQPLRIVLTVAIASFFVSDSEKQTEKEIKPEATPSTDEQGDHHE